MSKKRIYSALSFRKFRLALIIAGMSLLFCVPQALAVYEYENPEKDVYLWVVGVAEARAQYLTLEGNIEPVVESGLYEPGLLYEGRVALYLRGKIKGKYLIDFLYDTAKKNPQHTLFSTIDPDKYYPVYGDSSTLRKVGESQDQLYVSIRSEESYLTYGSYGTDFNETTFSSYNRTLQGIKANYQQKGYSLSVFRAVTPQVAFHDEIRGDGTSGYYRLSHQDIIEGSERVVIEIRDEDDPDKIIESTILTREIDYYIDYSEGMILFKKPVPSRDANGNPVWIIIDYEYMPEATDLEHHILGVRAEVKPSENFDIGASYLSDTDSPSKSEVYGVDAVLSLPNKKLDKPKAEIHAEYAHSINGADPAGPEDNAYSAELITRLFPNLELKGYYREVGKDFHHPQKSYDAGTQKYGIEAKLKFTNTLGLAAEQSSLLNKIEEGKTTTTKIGVPYQGKSLSFLPYYKQSEYSNSLDPTQDTLTTGEGITVETKVSEKITLSGGYQTEEKQFVTSPNMPRERSDTTELGAKLKLNKDTEFFAHYAITKEESQQTRATTVGVNVFENTSFYTKYTIEGTISGIRNQASIGMNTKVPLTPQVSANLAFEKTLVDEEEATTAFSGILEYLPHKNLKSTLKYETRVAPEETKNIVTFATVGKISPNLSLIGKLEKYEEYDNSLSEPKFLRNKDLIGLAYRPVNNDRLNLLLKYEFDEEKDLTDEATVDLVTKISSIEGIYDLTPRIELFGKYAFREKNERSVPPPFTAISNLTIAGITFKLTQRFGLGGEYRIIDLPQIPETRTGYSLEASYDLFQHIMLVLGYGWTTYNDLRFGENDYWAEGPYLRLLYKF